MTELIDELSEHEGSDYIMDIIDEIIDKEETIHIDNNIINTKRYIGISFYDKPNNVNILASRISNKSFFHYTNKSIMYYLKNSSIMRIINPPESPHIIQIYIDTENAYISINKTIWIRLIQRTWRNVLKRCKILLRNPQTLFHREIYGAHSIKMPTLRGMLCGI
jgi:hypothetical protein